MAIYTKLKKSTLCILLTLSFKGLASIDSLAIGVGTQTQFIGKVQVDENGDKNRFEFNPYLSAALEISLLGDFSFFPEVGLLIPDSTRDPEISKTTFFTLAMFGYEINDWVLRAGLGLQMTSISANGGVQVLDNGNGQTSFPMPKGNSTSRNVITNIGVEYFLHKKWSARLDATIYNPFNKRNRAFGHQLAVHFHFQNLFGKSSKEDI